MDELYEITLIEEQVMPAHEQLDFVLYFKGTADDAWDYSRQVMREWFGEHSELVVEDGTLRAVESRGTGGTLYSTVTVKSISLVNRIGVMTNDGKEYYEYTQIKLPDRPTMKEIALAFTEIARYVQYGSVKENLDFWASISDDWDLNLFVSEGALIATMHAVTNGKTNTNIWRNIMRLELSEIA